MRQRAVVFVALAVFFGALFFASGAHFFPIVPIIILLFFLHGRWRWGRRRNWYHQSHRRDWVGRY